MPAGDGDIGGVDDAGGELGDGIVKGLDFCFCSGGQRIRIMSACTCSKVVVTFVSASGVIPDHLYSSNELSR